MKSKKKILLIFFIITLLGIMFYLYFNKQKIDDKKISIKHDTMLKDKVDAPTASKEDEIILKSKSDEILDFKNSVDQELLDDLLSFQPENTTVTVTKTGFLKDELRYLEEVLVEYKRPDKTESSYKALYDPQTKKITTIWDQSKKDSFNVKEKKILPSGEIK